MKKLEDIPKKDIFNVPDGYFEKLPGVIHARVATPTPSRFSMARFGLRYALPACILIVGAFFWYSHGSSSTDPESMLAAIDTEELIAYISESDLSTDELLDEFQFNQSDVDNIVDEIYGQPLDPAAAEEILDDLDL